MIERDQNREKQSRAESQYNDSEELASAEALGKEHTHCVRRTARRPVPLEQSEQGVDECKKRSERKWGEADGEGNHVGL